MSAHKQHQRQQLEPQRLSPSAAAGQPEQVAAAGDWAQRRGSQLSPAQQATRRKSALSSNGFFIDYSCTRRRSSAAFQARQQQQLQLQSAGWPRADSIAAGSPLQQQQSQQAARASYCATMPGLLAGEAAACGAARSSLFVPAAAAARFEATRKTSIFDPAGHSIAPQLLLASSARRKSTMVTCAPAAAAPPTVVEPMGALLLGAQAQSKARLKSELAQRVPVIGCSPTSIQASLLALEETRRYEKLLGQLRRHKKRKERRRRKRERRERERDQPQPAAGGGLRRKSLRAIKDAAALLNPRSQERRRRAAHEDHLGQLSSPSLSSFGSAASSSGSSGQLSADNSELLAAGGRLRAASACQLDQEELFLDENTLVDFNELNGAAQTEAAGDKRAAGNDHKSCEQKPKKGLVSKAMRRLALGLAGGQQQQQQLEKTRGRRALSVATGSQLAAGLSQWYYYYYLRQNSLERVDDLPLGSAALGSEAERRARLHLNYSLARIRILNAPGAAETSAKLARRLRAAAEAHELEGPGASSPGSLLQASSTLSRSTDVSVSLSSSSARSPSTSSGGHSDGSQWLASCASLGQAQPGDEWRHTRPAGSACNSCGAPGSSRNNSARCSLSASSSLPRTSSSSSSLSFRRPANSFSSGSSAASWSARSSFVGRPLGAAGRLEPGALARHSASAHSMRQRASPDRHEFGPLAAAPSHAHHRLLAVPAASEGAGRPVGELRPTSSHNGGGGGGRRSAGCGGLAAPPGEPPKWAATGQGSASAHLLEVRADDWSRAQNLAQQRYRHSTGACLAAGPHRQADERRFALGPHANLAPGAALVGGERSASFALGGARGNEKELDDFERFNRCYRAGYSASLLARAQADEQQQQQQQQQLKQLKLAQLREPGGRVQRQAKLRLSLKCARRCKEPGELEVARGGSSSAQHSRANSLSWEELLASHEKHSSAAQHANCARPNREPEEGRLLAAQLVQARAHSHASVRELGHQSAGFLSPSSAAAPAGSRAARRPTSMSLRAPNQRSRRQQQRQAAEGAGALELLEWRARAHSTGAGSGVASLEEQRHSSSQGGLLSPRRFESCGGQPHDSAPALKRRQIPPLGGSFGGAGNELERLGGRQTSPSARRRRVPDAAGGEARQRDDINGAARARRVASRAASWARRDHQNEPRAEDEQQQQPDEKPELEPERPEDEEAEQEEEEPFDEQRRAAMLELRKSAFTCLLLGARQCGKRTIVKCFVKLLNEFGLALDEYRKEKLLAKLMDCSERLQGLQRQQEQQQQEQQQQQQLERRQSAFWANQAAHNQHASRLNSWLGGPSHAVNRLLHLPALSKSRRLNSVVTSIHHVGLNHNQRRHTTTMDQLARKNSARNLNGGSRQSSAESNEQSPAAALAVPQRLFTATNKSDFDISYAGQGATKESTPSPPASHNKLQVPGAGGAGCARLSLTPPANLSPARRSTQLLTPPNLDSEQRGQPLERLRLQSMQLSSRRRATLSLKDLNKRRIKIRFKTRRQLNERYLGPASGLASKQQAHYDEQMGARAKKRRISAEGADFPDLFMVAYAVNDRDSFDYAKSLISQLRSLKLNTPTPVVLVANKIDLERAKVVKSEEGRALARKNACKYMEISCTIGFNLDNLLVGIRTQLVLKHHVTLNAILHHGKTPRSSASVRQDELTQRQADRETDDKQAISRGRRKSANDRSDNIIVRFYKRYVMDNYEQNYDCNNFSKL